MTLDSIQTLACSGLALFTGFAVLRVVPVLRRYNIPAPVLGGLLVALLVLAAHRWNVILVTFDTSLQSPLMIAFFASLGCNASVSLLKLSGRQVALLLALAAFFAVIQCIVGIAVAELFGLHPLFGVLAGATTLAGGPATGLAFAPLFEAAGVVGAHSIAVAAAMAGIISGGLVGGPVATWLIERHCLKAAPEAAVSITREAIVRSAQPAPAAESTIAVSSDITLHDTLKALLIILCAMWIGSYVSTAITATGVTLPGYIGAMLIGALVRNVDDRTGWLRLPRGLIQNIGTVCLAFFLAMALMNLKLWELSGLALPLLLNLGVQVLLVAAVCCWPVFQLMGRDYDAAVMGGGFIGFMLGTTANAMAVMGAIVERCGPAPRAFLVVPLVGAFFIDFTNALVITAFLNFFD